MEIIDGKKLAKTTRENLRLEVEELKEIAKKYNKTWAQVALKFCLQNNTVPLPKTNSKERALENIDLDFVITPEDMKYLRTFKQI